MNANKTEKESRCENLYTKGRALSLPPLPMKKNWAFPLFMTSLLFSFFLLTSLNMGLLTSLSTLISIQFQLAHPSPVSFHLPPPPPPELNVPRLAYFVSGAKGDLDRLWRTLLALYHPRNVYLLHLEVDSPRKEREELAARAANHSLFSAVGNVHVVAKANIVTYSGPTMVANTLHACALLLKQSRDWDWFINLSASDYPLVTQDDLLFQLSKLPRNLNFIEHTSKLKWKEGKRAKPMIIDPGLYRKTKSNLFWVTQKRELPDAFQLFTGSAWMVLSREFVEYSIWGWDNLPRTLLMYYTNFISSPEGYFQTVICNAAEFNTTVVNHDLHYIAWDFPPKQHPQTLTLNDTAKMIESNAPFARKFNKNDPVLDLIDVDQLHRQEDRVTPGGWCSGNPLCSNVTDDSRLEPGPGSERLAQLMDRLLVSDAFNTSQCN